MNLRWILQNRGNIYTRQQEADREWKCQMRTATRDAYRVANHSNQQRMAARRALEWIGTSKAWLLFRYDISDYGV